MPVELHRKVMICKEIHPQNNQTYLSCCCLPDEAGCYLLGNALCVETETADVGVRRRAVLAIVALDLADLHHLGGL